MVSGVPSVVAFNPFVGQTQQGFDSSVVSTHSVSGKYRAIRLRATDHQSADNIIGELKKVDSSSSLVWVVQQERLTW